MLSRNFLAFMGLMDHKVSREGLWAGAGADFYDLCSQIIQRCPAAALLTANEASDPSISEGGIYTQSQFPPRTWNLDNL